MEMKKSERTSYGGIVDMLLRRRPLLSSYASRSSTMTSSNRWEVINRPSFRAGHATEGPKIHEIQAQECRSPKATIQGCTEVPSEHSWSDYMDQPMAQKVSGTCVVVACVVCLLAVHRMEYVKKQQQQQKLHGDRDGDGGFHLHQFPWRCMDAALRRLFVKCVTDDIWESDEGAYVDEVLTKIQEMKGLPAINAPITLAERVLPLRSWEMHSWEDNEGLGLCPERVATLLYNNGPCIGLLWIIDPLYNDINTDDTKPQVYTTGGCCQNHELRCQSMDEHGYEQVGWHAVVCFGYRRFGDGMHVLVLDNHTPTGPRRWIDVMEFHTLYTLTVDSVAPPGHHQQHGHGQ